MTIQQALRHGHVTGIAEAADIVAVPTLAELSPTGAKELASATRWSVYDYGQRIIDPRHGDHSIIIIATGLVSLYAGAMGRKLIWSILAPGRVIGLLPLPPVIAGVAYLVALESDTVVLRTQRARLRRVLESHGKVAVRLAEQADAMFHDAAELSSDLRLCQPEASLAHALARFGRAFPGRPILLTREELGHMCGLSRSQVTEELPKPLEKSLVDYEPGHHGPIDLLDVGALGLM